MTDALIAIILVCGFFLTATVIYIIVPHLYRLKRTKILKRQCQSGRIIALTYDDGPGTLLTKKLLECLAKEDVRATFFVLGNRADAAENLVQKYIESKHDVGSHSYNHLHAWKVFPGRCVHDIELGRKTVDRLGGIGSFFRPTYGKLNIWSFLHLIRNRYRILWWTIDTADSLETPKPVEQVLEEIDTQGGGVVLMHDYDQYKTGEHIDYVLTMTQAIIAHARSNNMRLLPLSEIIDRPTVT